MDTRTVTVPLKTVIPEDAVTFKVRRNREPVEGAKVVLCTKGLVPLTFSKITDTNGSAIFYVEELVPDIGEAIFNTIPWLLFANLPDSDYGFWKDNAHFELGNLYTYSLKRYTKAPTFYIKIQLRDMVGAELFSTFITEVQTTALEWAGLEVDRIEGRGTRTVTVYFTPAWHESPIVIEWGAVWFILQIAAIAGLIFVALYMLKWTFGEVGAAIIAAVSGIGIIVIALFALGLAKPVKERIEERYRGRRG